MSSRIQDCRKPQLHGEGHGDHLEGCWRPPGRWTRNILLFPMVMNKKKRLGEVSIFDGSKTAFMTKGDLSGHVKSVQGSRVIRGVGGCSIRPKKCLTPSGNEISWNRLKLWQIPIETWVSLSKSWFGTIEGVKWYFPLFNAIFCYFFLCSLRDFGVNSVSPNLLQSTPPWK